MDTVDNNSHPGDGKTVQPKRYHALYPNIPLIIMRVILRRALHSSESAKYLDLRSEVTISILKFIFNHTKPMPVSKSQAMTLRDPGVKGRIWISTVASEVPPERDVLDALVAAIDAMKDPKEEAPLRIPDIAPVEAEWTGYRAAATPKSTPPAISEEQKYHELMKECTGPATVLYFHGGAYFLCDPVTHRPLTKKLAKLTGGRVYSVRFRLAPQHPFPTDILDGLVSYFTLLYPPPGAVHEAVAPGNIVISGDSSGGHLCLSLLQALLEIRRQNRKIRWFGEEREVPLPAGVAVNGPAVDMGATMPSWDTNQKWDYLPTPRFFANSTPPPDAVWPANPPRKYYYIDDAYILHPLSSLQLNNTWQGAPPFYICCGWECLADEDKWLVSKLTRDGVKVVFEEYEAMPHVFVSMIPHTQESRRCLEGWTKFITAVCEDPQKVESKYTTIKAKTLQEVDIDVDSLTPFTDEEVRDMAYQGMGKKEPLHDVPAKL
ncbi:alpha/beta hydrolase fold-domain-containing protein [Xylariaceae sp. FL0662B]|nr:alpha/beta hydrolase fold-domain-containing protein [Xylariaceae sp. FL0662B]